MSVDSQASHFISNGKTHISYEELVDSVKSSIEEINRRVRNKYSQNLENNSTSKNLIEKIKRKTAKIIGLSESTHFQMKNEADLIEGKKERAKSLEGTANELNIHINDPLNTSKQNNSQLNLNNNNHIKPQQDAQDPAPNQEDHPLKPSENLLKPSETAIKTLQIPSNLINLQLLQNSSEMRISTKDLDKQINVFVEVDKMEVFAFLRQFKGIDGTINLHKLRLLVKQIEFCKKFRIISLNNAKKNKLINVVQIVQVLIVEKAVIHTLAEQIKNMQVFEKVLKKFVC